MGHDSNLERQEEEEKIVRPMVLSGTLDKTM
jgi:hypothetical protein